MINFSNFELLKCELMMHLLLVWHKYLFCKSIEKKQKQIKLEPDIS